MAEETRIVGDLPSLRMEIIHRQDENGRAEHMTIHLTAQPSLGAVESLMLGGLSPAAFGNPWLAWWADMAQAMLAPWAGALAAGNPWLTGPARREPK